MNSLMITLMLLGAAALVMGVPLKFEEFEDVGCFDDYPKECTRHAAVEGYCQDYSEYMGKHCRKACGICQPQVPAAPGCTDEIEGCAEHAANEGYCDYTNTFMRKYCKKTCKFCEFAPGGPPEQNNFSWDTTPWGKCKQGVQVRGVRCFHYFEGETFQVDLQHCRENLPDEVEPEDQRACVA